MAGARLRGAAKIIGTVVLYFDYIGTVLVTFVFWSQICDIVITILSHEWKYIELKIKSKIKE